jgi:hypothetical protein
VAVGLIVDALVNRLGSLQGMRPELPVMASPVAPLAAFAVVGGLFAVVEVGRSINSPIRQLVFSELVVLPLWARWKQLVDALAEPSISP